MSINNAIQIEVIADNQIDADLASRLIAASFNQNGFEDVTNISHPTHIDRDEEVVEAMRNLSPNIFNAEITIDTSISIADNQGNGDDDDIIPATIDDEDAPNIDD